VLSALIILERANCSGARRRAAALVALEGQKSDTN